MKIKDDIGEGTIEFEGTDVFVSGVRIAKRQGKKWVSLLPGVTVRDIKRGERAIAPELKSSIAGDTH